MSNDLATLDIDHEKVLQTLNLNMRDPRAQAVMVVCNKYQLDPVLKHVMIIQGTPYITKAGYFYIAHRSKLFDGIDIMEERETEKQCIARVAIYRKDMTRPFVTSARFNKSEAKGRDPMDMALARATRRGLQQAFDVADLFGNADEVHEQDLATDAAPGAGQFIQSFEAPKEIVLDVIDFDAELPAEAPQVVHANEEIPASAGDIKEEGGYKGVPGVAPFPDDDSLAPIPEGSAVEKLIGAFPGAVEETGEVADEVTRKRLQELITELDEEQRPHLIRKWKQAQLGALKNSAKGRKLLVAESAQAEALIKAQHIVQKDVYDKRRKHVNARLNEIGIRSDDARHAFIEEATNGETKSSKTLLGRQVQVINDLADSRKPAPAEEPEMFEETE